MFVKTLISTTILALAAVVSAQEDKTGWTGRIDGLDGGLEGTFEVVDETTLKVTGFTLEDGSAPALYWWGSETEALSSGFRISEAMVDGTHEDEELTISLDSGYTTDDFAYVGLWCETFNVNFGQAKLSEDGAAPAGGSGSGDDKEEEEDKPSAGARNPLGAVGALVAAVAVAGLMA